MELATIKKITRRWIAISSRIKQSKFTKYSKQMIFFGDRIYASLSMPSRQYPTRFNETEYLHPVQIFNAWKYGVTQWRNYSLDKKSNCQADRDLCQASSSRPISEIEVLVFGNDLQSCHVGIQI
jgi:hypothetical protein